MSEYMCTFHCPRKTAESGQKTPVPGCCRYLQVRQQTGPRPAGSMVLSVSGQLISRYQDILPAPRENGTSSSSATRGLKFHI